MVHAYHHATVGPEEDQRWGVSSAEGEVVRLGQTGPEGTEGRDSLMACIRARPLGHAEEDTASAHTLI